MSEQAPPAAAKGGNLLTRKLGPAPGWVWVGGGGLLVFLYLRHRAAASATATPAGATDPNAALATDPNAPAYDGGGSGYGGSLGTSGEDFSAVMQELSTLNAETAALQKSTAAGFAARPVPKPAAKPPAKPPAKPNPSKAAPPKPKPKKK